MAWCDTERYRAWESLLVLFYIDSSPSSNFSDRHWTSLNAVSFETFLRPHHVEAYRQIGLMSCAPFPP